MAKEEAPAEAERIHILEGVSPEEVGTIMLGLRDHNYEHAVWIEAVGSNDKVARFLIEVSNRKSDPRAFFEGMHVMAAITQGRGRADAAERALLASAEETTETPTQHRRFGFRRQRRHNHEGVGTVGATTLTIGFLGLKMWFERGAEPNDDDVA